MHLLLGTWPATQACALTGSKPVTLWFAGLHSIHWLIPARVVLRFYSTGKLTSYHAIVLCVCVVYTVYTQVTSGSETKMLHYAWQTLQLPSTSSPSSSLHMVIWSGPEGNCTRGREPFRRGSPNKEALILHRAFGNLPIPHFWERDLPFTWKVNQSSPNWEGEVFTFTTLKCLRRGL